jgi:hypothetical protein
MESFGKPENALSSRAASLLLFKDDRAPQRTTLDVVWRARREPFSGIRCPLCHWRPSSEARWCCDCRGTPEPFFPWCGTAWHTFTTRGRCPGCSHRWLWTSCMQCSRWSLHEDWYERVDPVPDL